MNIFAVDPDPVTAARSLCDVHIGKMMLESAQIMCAVMTQAGRPALYRIPDAGLKHPCYLWAATSLENFRWLEEHGWALHHEYMRRFDRGHAAIVGLASAREASRGIGAGEFVRRGATPWAQATGTPGADGARVLYHHTLPAAAPADPFQAAVDAYRLYYARKEAAWAREALGNVAAMLASVPYGKNAPVRPGRPVMTWRPPGRRPGWMPETPPRWACTADEATVVRDGMRAERAAWDPTNLSERDRERVERHLGLR